MEMEFFVPPEEGAKWFEYWCQERLGLVHATSASPTDQLRLRAHDADELSHYCTGTADVEFMYPWGWGELEGIANRTDYDLTQHSTFSGQDLSYFDQENDRRYVPHVIEPAAGADRATLAFLLAAYDEEEVPDAKGGTDKRALLRLDPRLAPIKVAVLPLSKNERLVPLADEIAGSLRRHFMIDVDIAGSIGKRYRRQDEVGTPLCVTIDFDSLDDRAVTVRDRDTMQQERVDDRRAAPAAARDAWGERVSDRTHYDVHRRRAAGGEGRPEGGLRGRAGRRAGRGRHRRGRRGPPGLAGAERSRSSASATTTRSASTTGAGSAAGRADARGGRGRGRDDEEYDLDVESVDVDVVDAPGQTRGRSCPRCPTFLEQPTVGRRLTASLIDVVTTVAVFVASMAIALRRSLGSDSGTFDCRGDRPASSSGSPGCSSSRRCGPARPWASGFTYVMTRRPGDREPSVADPGHPPLHRPDGGDPGTRPDGARSSPCSSGCRTRWAGTSCRWPTGWRSTVVVVARYKPTRGRRPRLNRGRTPGGEPAGPDAGSVGSDSLEPRRSSTTSVHLTTRDREITVKYVYAFEEGNRDQKFLLGGKGANLAEMTNLGLPVPPGFTITTEACKVYMAGDDAMPEGLMDEVAGALTALEVKMGKTLGDVDDPLLVSVRSGAAFSMPGMMDTVLNLGLNDVSVQGLAKQTGNERFAFDSYRRFVQMFGKIVLDVPGDAFEHAIEALREEQGVATDPELTADDLRGLVETFKGIVRDQVGIEFPQEPTEQLAYAVEAVFKSWNGDRAKIYRRMEDIPDDLGTAVNVQTMAFGNKGEDSGTGVAFTRDPATGENRPYGDFLANAQGEDVVAGIRVTEPLEAMGNHFPECHTQLLEVMHLLQNHYRDMCDIEFTIEQGRLFILQTRVGKRTAAAALRMAVEMEEEGLIDKREAVLRVQPEQLDQMLHPQFDPDATYTAITKGLNASPGAAVGQVYFTADDAEAKHLEGQRVILVRPETSPDDLHGMIAAEGILTSRGGLVSPRGRRRPRHGNPGRLRCLGARHQRREPPVPRGRHRRGGRRRHLDQRLHR